MKIEDKVALVTGGAGGIGKALSARLLKNGAKFVAILDVDTELAQKTVAEFTEEFGKGKVRFIYCDVANDEKLRDSFQEAFDVHGKLDIVVNNAGIASTNSRKTVEINLIAVINGCFIAEQLMTREKRKEKGVIINTASMAVFSSSGLVNSSYCATKHGVVGLTKSLPHSADGFSKDLRVAAICPSVVLTNIFKSQDVMSDEKMTEVLSSYMDVKVDIAVVIDAFILAIEDENLHGAIITVTQEGIQVMD